MLPARLFSQQCNNIRAKILDITTITVYNNSRYYKQFVTMTSYNTNNNIHYCTHTQKLLDILNTNSNQQHSNNNNNINILELLSYCIDLAYQSGNIIRDVFNSKQYNVTDKSGNNDANNKLYNPQTIADIHSQYHIINTLQSLYNNQLTIIGEEGDINNDRHTLDNTSLQQSFNKPRNNLLQHLSNHNNIQLYNNITINDISIWIDPLDGTREFTEGHSEYVTTLIGIAYKQYPIAGVISQPFSDNKRVVYGLVGLQAYQMLTDSNNNIQHKLLSISNNSTSSNRRVTTSRSHMSEGIQKILDTMNITDVIRCGGSGSKVLLLLDNQADIYLFPQNGTHRWDTASSTAILHSIGGCMTDSYGQQYDYSKQAANNHHNNRGVVAASNQKLLQQFTLDNTVQLSKF